MLQQSLRILSSRVFAGERKHYQQECIPVGCVPSAAVAVSVGRGDPGVCLPRGCVCPGVVYAGRGVYAGGVSTWGGVVSAQGGVCQTSPVNKVTCVKSLSCRNYVADGNNKSLRSLETVGSFKIHPLFLTFSIRSQLLLKYVVEYCTETSITCCTIRVPVQSTQYVYRLYQMKLY